MFVRVVHIIPFFLLVDVQHTQSASILHPREIQALWSQTTTQAARLYQVDAAGLMVQWHAVGLGYDRHKIQNTKKYASYPDTVEESKKKDNETKHEKKWKNK